jgi:hypothetical protein
MKHVSPKLRRWKGLQGRQPRLCHSLFLQVSFLQSFDRPYCSLVFLSVLQLTLRRQQGLRVTGKLLGALDAKLSWLSRETPRSSEIEEGAQKVPRRML